METALKELLKQREILVQSRVKNITLSQSWRIAEEIKRIDVMLMEILKPNVAP